MVEAHTAKMLNNSFENGAWIHHLWWILVPGIRAFIGSNIALVIGHQIIVMAIKYHITSYHDYRIDYMFESYMYLSGKGWIVEWAPFHKRFFHRNSNSMEISFHSHLDSNTVIATKFCTWHGSCAVVACAKICCDLMASNGITVRRSFHRI